MADDAQVIRGISWRETFPFTHIFRAFRVAVHPSKLVLAVILLLLLYFGGRVLDRVWPAAYLPTFDELFRYDITQPSGRGIFITFFTYEIQQVDRLAASVFYGRWLGGDGVVDSIVNFVATGPVWLYRSHVVFAVLLTLWFTLLWSVFGGAIARIAAVHVARDEKISMRQSLRFSVSKLLSFVFAPLIPLLIVLAVGAILAIGGLLMYVPYVGPILVGAFFFLALIGGFVITLLLLGTGGGFNLMYPTVAVEGSDSFDAISRSFSYVYARPWRMLFYTLVAVGYGALAYLFVRFFLYLVLALTHFFVGWWLTGQPGTFWPVIWPPPHWDHLPYTIDFAHLKWSEATSAVLLSIWAYLTVSLLGAFAISFYFSANTIIYYLMRQEVDATELDDVYLEQAEEDFATTGTAEMPASAETAPPAGAAPGQASSQTPGA